MGLTRTLLVASTGAALAYFLDPVSGGERRRKVRDYWQERAQGGHAAPREVEDEVAPTIVVNKQPAPRSTAK
jgi:hypothetical protein